METTPLKSVVISKLPVGNQVPRYSGWKPLFASVTSFSAIVGNQVPRYSGWKHATKKVILRWWIKLETKYRDIADGNKPRGRMGEINSPPVGNQVPRYSGFKTDLLMESGRFIELSSSVVSITNVSHYTLCTPQQIQTRT